jgi:hypothetical protein
MCTPNHGNENNHAPTQFAVVFSLDKQTSRKRRLGGGLGAKRQTTDGSALATHAVRSLERL